MDLPRFVVICDVQVRGRICVYHTDPDIAVASRGISSLAKYADGCAACVHHGQVILEMQDWSTVDGESCPMASGPLCCDLFQRRFPDEVALVEVHKRAKANLEWVARIDL